MDCLLTEEKVEEYVVQVFSAPYQPQYPYHNLKHTKAVVTHAAEICNFYSLNETGKFIVIVAAWFHDIGQLYGPAADHEVKSVAVMNDFFKVFDIPAELVGSIGKCIMATKLHVIPENLPGKIICDADTWHFGTPYFRQTEFLIKKEMEMRNGEVMDDWHTGSLQLLQHHVFYTEYCQTLLAAGKKENIQWLETLINK